MRFSLFAREKEKEMVRCVVAGFLGEVGSAIYSILKDAGYEVYGVDLKKKESFRGKKINFLHICIPFENSQKFINEVKKLVREVDPERIIIHSSVLPGTSKKIHSITNLPVCYSPIRGQHDSLKQDILRYAKYISPLPKTDCDVFMDHLRNAKLKVIAYNRSPNELELVKILDTCQYLSLIAWAQEAERILRRFGFNYNLLRDFGEEHVKFYPEKRANIFPGVAGGHCLVPNAKLILKIYNSPFLKLFLKSNEQKMKEEIK